MTDDAKPGLLRKFLAAFGRAGASAVTARLHINRGPPPRGSGRDGDWHLDTTPGAMRLHGPRDGARWPAGMPVRARTTADDVPLTTRDGTALATARGKRLAGDAPLDSNT